MTLAPVIVFNYNRPDHSKRTWEELSKNLYATETELFLYCDGPKDNATTEVRNRIKEIQSLANDYATNAKQNGLFKDVHVITSDKNKGLANSIINGVTEVINKYGKAIILEDDLLTSPYFLKYMNEALDFYEKYPAVFSISGYNHSSSQMAIPADYHYYTYVSLRAMSWGWATWKDRWERIDFSMNGYPKFASNHRMINAFNRGGDDVSEMLGMQWDRKIDSWAIRFGFAHFVNHAVAILPTKSFVKNIGLDGSGTHCHAANVVEEITLNNDSNFNMLDVLYEDADLTNSFYNVYCRTKRPFWQKAINYTSRLLGKKPPFIIKKKIYNV